MPGSSNSGRCTFLVGLLRRVWREQPPCAGGDAEPQHPCLLFHHRCGSCGHLIWLSPTTIVRHIRCAAALRRSDRELCASHRALHPRFPQAHNNRSKRPRRHGALSEGDQRLFRESSRSTRTMSGYYNRDVSFAELGQLSRAIGDVT